jgi:nitroimidazol reductase NimA-like FMN-containing flavoprotein (pyridoxamine 5'-phosphate oxidase superfamily)
MLLSFLTRKGYAVLATTRADGRPQAAPVGYSLVGTKFVMASLADGQRVRNLRNKPHASLVITEDEGDEHGVVIAEGTTRLLQPLEAGLDMRAPFRDDAGNLPDWIGILVVLTPERLLSFASKGFKP